MSIKKYCMDETSYENQDFGLSGERNGRLKRRVMYNAGVEVAYHLQKEAKGVFLSPSRKLALRESLLTRIQNMPQRSVLGFMDFLMGPFVRRGLSMAMVFALVLLSFSYWTKEESLVYAESFTRLENFDGEVEVLRNGEVVSPSMGMELLEGDKVSTEKGGFATIEYFDDSVSRISESSVVVLDKLSGQEDEDKTRTMVQISIEKGMVWSSVINLVEDRSVFVVKAPTELDVLTTRSSFNVDVDTRDVEVEVFNHTLEVVSEKRNVKNRVFSGSKAVMDFDNENLVVQPMKAEDHRRDWIVKNLHEDQGYVKKVEIRKLAEKKQLMGGKIADSLDVDVDKEVEGGEVEDMLAEKKRKLDLVERKFIAAQLILAEGDSSDPDAKLKAEKAYEDFRRVFEETYGYIAEVGKDDKETAELLKVYLEQKLAYQKKELAIVLPDSPVYGAKRLIEEIEILGASDGQALLAVQHSIALEKLGDIEKVVSSGNKELASKLVDEYKYDLNRAMVMAENIERLNLTVDSTNQELLDQFNVKDEFVLDSAVTSVNATTETPEPTVVAEPPPTEVVVVEPVVVDSEAVVDADVAVVEETQSTAEEATALVPPATEADSMTNTDSSIELLKSVEMTKELQTLSSKVEEISTELAK